MGKINNKHKLILASIVVIAILLLQFCDRNSVVENDRTNTETTNEIENKKTSQKSKKTAKKSSKRKKTSSESIKSDDTINPNILPELKAQIIAFPLTVIIESAGTEDIDSIINEEDPDEILIKWENLRNQLQRTSKPETLGEMESKTVQTEDSSDLWISLKTIKDFGYTVTFSEERQEVYIKTPVENKGRRTIELRTDRRENRNDFTNDPISGYVNFFGSNTNTSGELYENIENKSRFSHVIDGVINIKNWVFEFMFAGDEDTGTKTKYARLVKDDVNNGVRYKLGTITSQREGFLSGNTILGASVETERILNRGKIIIPVNEFEILLKERSLVSIVRNNTTIFTSTLESGIYDIRNFPLVIGSNDLKILVKDPKTQEVIEEHSITSFSYSRKILRTGNHEFTYSAGVKEFYKNTGSDEITFLGKDFNPEDKIFTLSHRYGLLDRLTVSVYGQLERFYSLYGAGATVASPIGVFNLENAFSLNKADDSKGFASRLEYLNTYKSYSFSLGAEKRFREFTLSGEKFSDRSLDHSYFASVGFPIIRRLSGHISGSIYETVGGQTRYRYSLGLNSRPFRNVTFGAVGRYDVPYDHSKAETSVQLHLSWNFESGNLYAYTDSRTQSETVNVTAYKKFDQATSIDYGAGLNRLPGTNTYSAMGKLNTSKGYVYANNSIRHQDEGYGNTLNISGGTAIAFVGTEFAWTKPLTDSFVLVKGYEAIEDQTLLVDPNHDYSKASAKTDFLGTAFVPTTSYNERKMTVVLEEQTPDLLIKQESYLIYPSYRSGSLIKISAEHTLTINGKLLGTDNNPLYEVSGEMELINKSEVKDEPVFFFTNKDGVFFTEGLRHRKYKVTLYDENETSFEVDLSGTTESTVNLGEIYAPTTKRPKD